MLIEVQEIIGKSADKEKCYALALFSKDLLENEGVFMSDIQWTAFVSHLSGMVFRSVHNAPIDALDPGLFKEVSQKSITLAEVIVKKIQNLHDDEKYLLSIHFEAVTLH